MWSVALARADGDAGHVAPFWRLYVEVAARYGTVFVDRSRLTASVWVPPGGTEVSDEQSAQLDALVERSLPPDRAAAMHELWDRFDEHHLHDEPHWYLSLLATHPDAAGHGYGMAHLAADLARWDDEGVPSYLESSNPVNDRRYERAGCRRTGEFTTVLDGAVVGTYWRLAGG